VIRKSRFPNLFTDESGQPLRGLNGRLLCRGCAREVPEGRRTWCSQVCIRKYHPREVKLVVWMRDKGTCRRCSLDLVAQFRRRHPNTKRKTYKHFQYYYPRGVEFDHFMPFSEGGPTIAENMRVLCRKCHSKVTAEWRRQKARNAITLRSGFEPTDSSSK